MQKVARVGLDAAPLLVEVLADAGGNGSIRRSRMLEVTGVLLHAAAGNEVILTDFLAVVPLTLSLLVLLLVLLLFYPLVHALVILLKLHLPFPVN